MYVFETDIKSKILSVMNKGFDEGILLLEIVLEK